MQDRKRSFFARNAFSIFLMFPLLLAGNATLLAVNPPPTISSLSITQGASIGGDTVIISGANFQPGATVMFGATPAASVTYVSSTSLRVVTPARPPSVVDVGVINPDNQSAYLRSLLHDQGFELGNSYWKFSAGGGTISFVNNKLNAHVGTNYAEISTPGAGSHPVLYAADVNGNAKYFPVNPGDSITFGGATYLVSGNGYVRWMLEVTDANQSNATYIPATPSSAYDPIWITQQGTYTIPSGKAFVRLYAEISSSTTATVARFDDAVLQRTPGNYTGFDFIAPPILNTVTPYWGTPAGGTTRTIYGTGFTSNAVVTFGGVAGTNLKVVNANAIEVSVPPRAAGQVDVAVAQGTQSGTMRNGYTYQAAPAPPSGSTNLKHIIFTFQENRSFDDYFSQMNKYRQTKGYNDNAADVMNLGIAMPDIAGNMVKPFHLQTECHENTSPSWNSQHTDVHGGAMDWFMKTGNNFTGPSIYDPNGTRAIGYFDNTDLPYYYELGFQFAISDRWFSPMLGPTGSNRAYTLAATSLGWVSDPQPPTGGFPNLTIFDLLDQAGISWRYYYQKASPTYIKLWSTYGRDSSKVVPVSNYYNDVKDESTFPQVVFIEEGQYDEHPKPDPGTIGNAPASVQLGAASTKSLIDALMASQTWGSSAFILSYDEGGGTHDHVPPKSVTAPDGIPPKTQIGIDAPGLFNSTGLRVPVVVVSPWIKPHFVSHIQRDHTSILKLIESRFGLPPLTSRDYVADNMMEFFDFTSPAWGTPPAMPAQPTNGACDLSLEKAPAQ